MFGSLFQYSETKPAADKQRTKGLYLVAGIASRCWGSWTDRPPGPHTTYRDNVLHKFYRKTWGILPRYFYYAVVYLQVILRRSTRWVYTSWGWWLYSFILAGMLRMPAATYNFALPEKEHWYVTWGRGEVDRNSKRDINFYCFIELLFNFWPIKLHSPRPRVSTFSNPRPQKSCGLASASGRVRNPHISDQQLLLRPFFRPSSVTWRQISMRVLLKLVLILFNFTS